MELYWTYMLDCNPAGLLKIATHATIDSKYTLKMLAGCKAINQAYSLAHQTWYKIQIIRLKQLAHFY